MYPAKSPMNGHAHLQPHNTLPEVMYSMASLSDLYEIGLISVGPDTEAQELRQHILTHLRRPIRAVSACLLLYNTFQQHFIAVASQGDKVPCGPLAHSINGREMEQLALRGPGETIASIQLNEQHFLVVTLSHNHSLLGVVALAVDEANTLQDERGLLISYMGNVAAVLLHNYETRMQERTKILEQERKRIGREIHDGVLQQLAYVLHKLEFIQHILDNRQLQIALSEVKRTHNVLENGMQDLRASLNTLLPEQLERKGLPEALEALFRDFAAHQANIELVTDINEARHTPTNLVSPIFHLIQEALHNIGQHAHATQVHVSVRLHATLLTVEVSDNGVGFQADPQLKQVPENIALLSSKRADDHHFGLQTMQGRVQEAGGTWECQSKPDHGTIIHANFPLGAETVDLTMREQEILRLIVDGLNNRDIAQRLEISNDTVKTHIHHIIQKLRVKDRAQAALVAVRYGWIK